MARRFRPIDLVQLPTLDSSGAKILGAEVVAAAAGKTLPPAVAEAVSEVMVAHQALERIAERRLPAADRADPVARRAADTILDAAWSALCDVLRGWSKLPDHPDADLAAGIQEQLFPDGLRFTQLPFEAEWAESDTRLRIIEARGLAADLDRIGVTPVLEQLRSAHRRYGEVLDVTAGAGAAPAPPSVRAAMDALTDALRVYVVRVTASVRKHDPHTAALAQELLAPVQRWQAARPATDPPVDPATASEPHSTTG